MGAGGLLRLEGGLGDAGRGEILVGTSLNLPACLSVQFGRRLAMSEVEVGGLIVMGIVVLDVALGYALARWRIDL